MCDYFLGFSISAARLGLPDTGFISFGEMVDQGRLVTEAVSIPVIGDGDNGYGNAMNVKRTVKAYIRAGFAGIILEDQVYIYIICVSNFLIHLSLRLFIVRGCLGIFELVDPYKIKVDLLKLCGFYVKVLYMITLEEF